MFEKIKNKSFLPFVQDTSFFEKYVFDDRVVDLNVTQVNKIRAK